MTAVSQYDLFDIHLATFHTYQLNDFKVARAAYLEAIKDSGQEKTRKHKEVLEYMEYAIEVQESILDALTRERGKLPEDRLLLLKEKIEHDLSPDSIFDYQMVTAALRGIK